MSLIDEIRFQAYNYNKIDNKEKYVAWAKHSIELVDQVLKNSKNNSEMILFHVAKRIAFISNTPSEYRERVWKYLEDAHLLPDLERVCIFFRKLKRDPGSHTPSFCRSLSWLNFPPLTKISFSENFSNPLSLEQLHFSLYRDNTSKNIYPSWEGMAACLCPRSSPKGIDALMQMIAKDLNDQQEAVIIDFGSGGCLPLLPLVTRLSHLRKLTFILIDPKYQVKDQFAVHENFDSTKFQTEKDVNVLSFINFCKLHLNRAQDLQVIVCGSEAEARKYLKRNPSHNLPHVLYMVDPMPLPDYIRKFRRLSQYLEDHDKLPKYYCLNECLNICGSISLLDITKKIFLFK